MTDLTEVVPDDYSFKCASDWHRSAVAWMIQHHLNNGNSLESIPAEWDSRYRMHDDLEYTVHYQGQVLTICNECWDYASDSGNLSVEQCADCDEISVSRFGGSHRYYDSMNGGLCEDCHESYVDNGDIALCDQCECWYVVDEGECCTPRLIHSYSHKPDPQFKPELPNIHATGYSRRYVGVHYGRSTYLRDSRTREAIAHSTLSRYGVELEFEIHGASDREVAEYIRNYDSSESIVLAKYDGSLNYGIELNFHPRSLESWNDYALELDKFLQGLIDMGCRADRERSTGIHIHSNRLAYDSPSHIWRVLRLVGGNETGMTTFARRSSHFANFDNISRPSMALALAFRRAYGDHFDAVNVCTNTLEFRLFRSSLRAGRLLANIQFIDSINEFTRFMSLKDIQGGALSWDQLSEFINSKQEYSLASHALAGGKFYNSTTLTTQDEE